MNTPRYEATSTLPQALRVWSRKTLNSIPVDRAPCGYLPFCDDENQLLARIFLQLCALGSITDRQAFLAGAVITHERRLKMAWDSGPGERDPRRVGASDRSTWSRLKPYEAMVDVLRLWMEELHEAALGEVGVLLIDEAARKRAS